MVKIVDKSKFELIGIGGVKCPFSPNNRSNSLHKLFKMWIAQNKLCYHCGVKTFIPKKNKRVGVTKLSDRRATTDHLYPRWDIRRALSSETVMSCHKCNKERDNQFKTQMKSGYEYDGVYMPVLNPLIKNIKKFHLKK